MKTATKTLMTLIGAGSLLLISVAVISAELSKTLSQEGQQGISQNNFLNSSQEVEETSQLSACFPKEEGTGLQNRSIKGGLSLGTISSVPGKKYLYSKVLCG